MKNVLAIKLWFLIFALVSVKEDARDLLQKYSDLLVEEIAKKL